MVTPSREKTRIIKDEIILGHTIVILFSSSVDVCLFTGCLYSILFHKLDP